MELCINELLNVLVDGTQPSYGLQGMSGTSMATPSAAGNAALVRQYYSEGFGVSGKKVIVVLFYFILLYFILFIINLTITIFKMNQ